MSFPFNVYLLALMGGGLSALLALPLFRSWCRRIGLVDDPGHRKIHEAPIPLAGGLAVLTGLLLPVAAAALYLKYPVGGFAPSAAVLQGFGRRASELGAILLGAIAVTGLGVLDDKHELRPATKFVAQALIALLVASSGLRITLFVPSVMFSYAITVLWLLTVINAFNFMDNMNGLCTGLGAISSFLFGLLAALEGQYLVVLMAFLISGALLGFLPYNFPKASAFLGDAGSHLVGYLLAVMAILPHFYTLKHPRTLAVFTPLLILAVPLIDLVWVVIIRWRAGKPFYLGDNNHLSHRLVRRGLSPVRAVLLVWLLAALLGSLAFL